MTNHWTVKGSGSMSLKAPTSILLNPDQKFHAFGYDADQRYTELAQKGLNKEWYYFQKFKMKLQGNMVRHMTYCYIGIRHIVIMKERKTNVFILLILLISNRYTL